MQLKILLSNMVIIITLATLSLFLGTIFKLANLPGKDAEPFKYFIGGILLTILIQWIIAGLFCLVV